MTVSKKKTKCLSCFHKIRKGFGDNETAVRKDSPLACVSKVFFFSLVLSKFYLCYTPSVLYFTTDTPFKGKEAGNV